MTRLLIIEDHAAIAQGLSVLLASPDISIVGIAGDAETAGGMITTLAPDLVLCDVMLGGRDAGFDLLDRHGDRSRFVMYTAFDYPAHHARALKGGAAGYLSKLADGESIVRALRHVAAGGQWFPRSVLDSARRAPRPPTDREHQLLVLLAEGEPNEGMARIMGLRVKTIEGMIRRLFDRYGVDNRTQLARFAMRQGWLTSVDESGAPASPPREHVAD
ncbi:MAG: response regulator transcription factor [Chloroflexota bacterium]